MLYTVSRTSDVLLVDVFLARGGELLGLAESIGGDTRGSGIPVLAATPVGVSGGGTILNGEFPLLIGELDLFSNGTDGRGGNKGDST